MNVRITQKPSMIRQNKCQIRTQRHKIPIKKSKNVDKQTVLRGVIC